MSTKFNLNNKVTDINIDYNTPDSWDCRNSNYPPAGHVITGNLNDTDTLLIHKAIMAHEHINKYKYNTIQDSEIHKTQHSCNTMTAFQIKI